MVCHEYTIVRRTIQLLSSVDVFQVDCGDWTRPATSGTPPLGVDGYCCTAVGGSLYYYGGYCGHAGCYHNSVHKLSTSSLQLDDAISLNI